MNFFEWIITEENGLTDRAKLDLGDMYMLTKDLLESMPFIESFFAGNHISHFFDSQIVKDFYLAILNIIRRHSLVSNLLIRHAIESVVLFVYSMEHNNEEEYVIQKDEKEILNFKENLLTDKAYKHIELKYPKYSEKLEGYKETINVFYSHANIYSSQYNAAMVDGRLKLLIFDNYYDDHIRDTLCVINDIICIVLKLYKTLENDYKSFVLIPGFDEKLEVFFKRHSKIAEDHLEKHKNRNLSESELIDKIFMKLDKKYNKKEDTKK
jgi:hypothetical protein